MHLAPSTYWMAEIGCLISVALVFNGAGDDLFRAFDAKTGQKLREDECGAGFNAPPPVSYTVGGKHVAVAATATRSSDPTPKMPRTPRAEGRGRYTHTAVWMHWLLGLAICGQIAFGFLLDDIAPRGTPARSGIVNLHKLLGIALAVLIAARVLWRLFHVPPPWPATMAHSERRAARLVHGALHACMVVMPMSGYIASNFSRFGINFFGFTWPPWAPALPQVYALFNGLHIVTAYVLCVLIAGHVLAAFKHAFVDRDDVFSRTLM